MATYTNKNKLPDALVRAIANDGYNKGNCDYSVTELIKPARLRRLEELHKDEIEEDVEDRLWSLYGQIAHLILERAGGNELKETRLFTQIGDKTISGQIDNLCLEHGVLSDYKFTTSWKFKNNSTPDDDWAAQLNMQAELLRRNGFNPKKLQIVGLLRDFSKPESFRNPDYPQTSVVVQDIPMWADQKVVAYIKWRISEHELAKENIDKSFCSPKDRWAVPDQWAVMKKGQKRAVKLCLIEKEAHEIASKDKDLSVQFRQGESKRCSLYCKVNNFCKQYKEMSK